MSSSVGSSSKGKRPASGSLPPAKRGRGRPRKQPEPQEDNPTGDGSPMGNLKDMVFSSVEDGIRSVIESASTKVHENAINDLKSQLKAKDDLVRELELQLKAKDDPCHELRLQLKAKDDLIQKQFASLEKQHLEAQKRDAEMNLTVSDLQGKLVDLGQKNADLETKHTELESKYTLLREKDLPYHQRDTELNQKEAQLQRREAKLKQEETQCQKREMGLAQKYGDLRLKISENVLRSEDLEHKDTELRKKTANLEQQDAELVRKQSSLDHRNAELKQKDLQYQQREAEHKQKEIHYQQRETEHKQKEVGYQQRYDKLVETLKVSKKEILEAKGRTAAAEAELKACKAKLADIAALSTALPKGAVGTTGVPPAAAVPQAAHGATVKKSPVPAAISTGRTSAANNGAYPTYKSIVPAELLLERNMWAAKPLPLRSCLVELYSNRSTNGEVMWALLERLGGVEADSMMQPLIVWNEFAICRYRTRVLLIFKDNRERSFDTFEQVLNTHSLWSGLLDKFWFPWVRDCFFLWQRNTGTTSMEFREPHDIFEKMEAAYKNPGLPFRLKFHQIN